MSAKFITEMLHSTLRRARHSVQHDLRGSSTRRFWFSTVSEKAAGPVTQRMKFASRYEDDDDLVCPVKYFKEELNFLKLLDKNELLNAIGKKNKTEIPIKVAKAVRSLAELILDNHALGIPLGESLRLDNLRISRSLGKFAMIQPPKNNTFGSLLGDYSRGADVLEELVRLVLGSDVEMPTVWLDFIAKMREEFPNVELIIYHSLFLPLNLRYVLRVLVDQRFRKDFYALKPDEKKAIRKFLKVLGEKRNDNILLLLRKDEFLKFVSLKSRVASKVRREKESRVRSKVTRENASSDPKNDEALWSDEARDIISINRDGVVHGCKKELEKEEKQAMPNIRNHWRTPESVVQLLAEQFDLLEQDYIDLSFDTAKTLWKVLGIPELFGETEETWKAAVEAIRKEVEAVQSRRLGKGTKVGSEQTGDLEEGKEVEDVVHAARVDKGE